MTSSKKEQKPTPKPATYAECFAFINGTDGSGLVKKSQVVVESK